MAGKSIRSEVDDLVREVRALRSELGAVLAAQAMHHCHGCSCVHVSTSPAPIWQVPSWPYYPTITCQAGGISATGSSLPEGTVISMVN